MSDIPEVRNERIIGRYGSGDNGTTIIATASLHGNEPAGVKALQELFALLNKHQPVFCGEIIGILGHVEAFTRGVRYIDKDLNRMWTREQVDKVKNSKYEDLKVWEEKEQYEIIRLFQHFLNTKDDILLLDLHTTSATGGIFTIANSLPGSIEAASSINVPVITGLSEVLDGTTMHFFESIGLSGVGFEGGQHYEESSVDNIIGAIAFLMEYKSCIDSDLTFLSTYKENLMKYGDGLPGVVQFKHRQAINDDDSFVMKPGYKNFQHVKEGEFLAFQNGIEVYSPSDGLILMPLYQKQGNDGFFIVQEC